MSENVLPMISFRNLMLSCLIFKSFFVFSNLAVPGSWLHHVRSSLRFAGSLVVACGIFTCGRWDL